MTTSDEEYLRGLYDGIFKDIVAHYPDDHREVDRDKRRLHLALVHRGIRTFTLDFPTLGKYFDKCLAEGRLTPTLLPYTRSSRRSEMTPRLFRALFDRVFERNGLLREQPDIQAVRFLRQLYYAGKKLKMACPESATFKTIAEFFQVDSEVALGDLPWQDDDFDGRKARELHLNDGNNDVAVTRGPFDKIDILDDCLNEVQELADRVSTGLGSFDFRDWTPRHGPGAVADQMRWENKYLFPHWPAKLERLFPLADVAFSNYSEWAAALMDPDVPYGMCHTEPPSRLIAVPKTFNGPRLIAAEPIAHQFCQQSILAFLTSRKRQNGGDTNLIGAAMPFRTQLHHRKAALEASRTGQMMTIDLSSASDRVSCWVVERIFRRNIPLLEALHAVRTRWISNKLDKKSPELYELRKFSTMGSAVTFPVQSYIFALVALGVYQKLYGVKIVTAKSRLQHMLASETGVLVFGDDIIVPTDIGGTVIAVLERLGFQVNHTKTFGTGRFRESCGMDAFMGHDVTPVYATQPPQQARPESMISAVTQCNNFFKKGYNYAAGWIKSTCTRIPLLRGLPSVPVDSGILGYPTWESTVHSGKRRWNADLQRMEYFYPRPLARTRTKHSQGSTGFLRFFLEGPGPDFIWSSAVNQRPSLVLRNGWGPLPT